jgi:hypothetical protein
MSASVLDFPEPFYYDTHMDTTTFALILVCIVCIAFIVAWGAMHYQAQADKADLNRRKWEARNEDRDYWLRMKEAETRQLLAVSAIFGDCKELSIDSPSRGHLRLNMSRRDHAPLPLPAPVPPMFITPTILAPQPLYDGKATELSIMSGRPEKIHVQGDERIEIRKVAP